MTGPSKVRTAPTQNPHPDPALPVLIAGPTASGKSALALEFAERDGGVIVNADALQVYDNWRVLSARPSDDDLARAPHALYGHVPRDADYSVGHWLREVKVLLDDAAEGGPRPIIVGGTGLYFSALTDGLAEIPPTPPEIRAQADRRRAEDGDHAGLLAELDAEDPETAQKIDRLNPMRVQRAWEVLRATGRGLSAWQAETPAPLLPLDRCMPYVLVPDPQWLGARIDSRFQAMISAGALEEARANLADWDPARPSSKAIGAPELIAHLRGECDLDAAIEAACTATRQFAKRQRTWFRSRMKAYHKISLG
ncbi:tRNA (adenosine(37)-N6)-dimethylallyltransferase MiaA [Celeribacter sp.]|uniref:tRNA (adenosine(37)-N6)-dimethylallyltransferase MiaA n=1 Tax=Celeribacter sp. TaxID=1890673 RepID=UPI003A920E18